MRIGVVIPARDEAHCIEAAVRSAQGPEVEVLVVDGGSRDATASLARAAGARVLASPAGRARQLGTGARACDAPVLLFLHADTELPAGWADGVRGALADARVAGGAFRLRFAEGGLGLRIVELGAALRQRLGGPPYGDQALFLRRAVLLAMGGVPQAPIFEDLDLARGIRAQGRLRLLPAPALTSGRRYLERGIARTWLRNALALGAWLLRLDRARVAAWYRS